MITGIPSGRSFARFDAFGICTRRTARGFHDDRDWCTRTAAPALASGVSATSPSIPAVLRPVLRCVTCRTLISVFDLLRSNTGRPAARCLPCGRPFSAGPRSEPRGRVSAHVALQWLCRGGGEGARVDGLMAGDADDERLPAHLGHELRPRGLGSSWPGEVSEPADLVDFHGRVLLAPLAPARAEPGDQLPADGCRD